MSEDFRRRKFDDDDREAVRVLINRFWILREQDPQLYRFVRERLPHIKHYFLDRYGYRIIDHRHFIKLEKVPAQPRAWMGIADFSHIRDYMFLSCLLAFLDERQVDEQFLLSQVCESFAEMIEGDPLVEPDHHRAPVNWQNWEQRKSLVRVLAFAVTRGIVREVDGSVSRFARDQDNEVLYEVPVVARYFAISYPQELSQFDQLDNLLAATDTQENPGQARRHRLHRALLLTPAFYRHEAEEEDFLYLRSQRHRMRDDFEARTPYQYEFNQHVALLAVKEQAHFYQTLPNKTGLSAVMLLFAGAVARRQREAEMTADAYGRLALTTADFAGLVADCRAMDRHGWAKVYRDMSPTKMTETLQAALAEWNLLEFGKDGIVYLLPALVRLVGCYPKRYLEEQGRREGREGASALEGQA